jgi:hypothetical protein
MTFDIVRTSEAPLPFMVIPRDGDGNGGRDLLTLGRDVVAQPRPD